MMSADLTKDTTFPKPSPSALKLPKHNYKMLNMLYFPKMDILRNREYSLLFLVFTFS